MPHVILFVDDEPTILDLLKKLTLDEGKTMILITHDPDAAAIAGRIIRLRDGRVVQEVRNA